MAQQGQKLFNWYQKNKRSLPWRKRVNFYRVWVAEIMLQQTTVKTVIPHYLKFLKKFPTLKSLATSSLREVLPYWSGLGYYSRVKNLHKASQIFYQQKYHPKTKVELQKYPTFGPYTSCAVSSQVYKEKQAVLDGNVIRVLCRHEAFFFEWWKKTSQKKLENISLKWMKNLDPGEMNQALMELGATICTPQKPRCPLCPIKKTCRALKKGIALKLPIKKSQKQKQNWLLRVEIFLKENRIILTHHHSYPFLKNQWLPPGRARLIKSAPKNYDFKHFITHYNIFVQVVRKQPNSFNQNLKWVRLDKIRQISPFSLTQKILKTIETK